MPPKQKKPNTSTEEDGKESFQAVILTDTFEEQFFPISHEIPRVNNTKQKQTKLHWPHVVILVSYANL